MLSFVSDNNQDDEKRAGEHDLLKKGCDFLARVN